MTALSTRAVRKGHKVMESTMTAAARVRRKLKAGRPRTVNSLALNSYALMGALVSQADRAIGLMEDAGLDPNDLRLGLIIRTGDSLHCMWLPPPGEAEGFFGKVSSIASAEFLGILWKQADREIENDGLPLVNYWVTPFAADAKAHQQMELLRAHAVLGGRKMSVEPEAQPK
jgi:hypothetical protein